MTDLARAAMTEQTPPGTDAPSGASAASPAAKPAGAMTATELGVARAAALFERVDPVRAAALLEQVLAADPESAEGWILLARVRLVLDQADGALDAAARAIALVPEDARPLAMASRG